METAIPPGWPSWPKLYSAVMATATTGERISVSLAGSTRQGLAARIRGYLAKHGYKLGTHREGNALTCWAERVR